MTEVLTSLLATLFGVLLDRLSAWHAVRRAAGDAARTAQLERRTQVERINARIDREVANEDDLGVLLDRL